MPLVVLQTFFAGSQKQEQQSVVKKKKKVCAATSVSGILLLSTILCFVLHKQHGGHFVSADQFGTKSHYHYLPVHKATTPSFSPRNVFASNRSNSNGRRVAFFAKRNNSINNYNNNNSNMKEQCPNIAEQIRGGHLQEPASTVLDTPYGLPLNVWKVLFQAVLTAINVGCWLIPLRSKQVVDNPLALSLANAFSGGVFLALAFGHLIPECLHGFPSDWNETAPFYLVLLGYLLIFFVEKVAFDAHDILHEMQAGSGSHIEAAAAAHSHAHSHGHEKKTTTPITNGSLKPAAVAASTPVTTTAPATSSTGRSAIILLGALGVHSILEMMALGLADTFRDGALLTASIALHQPAESIALLVAFLKSGLSQQEILTYLSVFSCMGPIGVALGMAVNEYAAPVVDAAMLAVVAGTFVYVGATEVIPEEWEDSQHKWKKFAALMTGIVSIAGITQYTMSLAGHDHAHAHTC